MKIQNFDILIIGAGPAGSACALMLADSGLNIAVIDKVAFPREKICGDGLSKDVINQINLLPPEIKISFDNIVKKLPSSGVRFYSPDNNCLEIPFDNNDNVSGYVCKRRYFDEILVNGLKKYSNIKLFENCEVIEVRTDNESVTINTKSESFSTKMIVGADGINSVVSKHFSPTIKNKKHLCLGLRGYFENVTGFHKENFIELHFYKDILPGYLWIFPMAGNMANVGIGMLASDVSKKKVNLKNILEKYIHTHPNISPRFENAIQIGKFEAMGIPLGAKKMKISGDRFLLAGDAASLVDPFTGEGIGNAIRSGRVAADHIKFCFKMNRFDEAFNVTYDKEIYRRMWNELKLSSTLQKLFNYPGLINYAVRKANRNEHFKKLVVDSMQNIDIKKKFLRPYLLYKTFLH
ncbi:MAG: geranylgeranyl reductase family protein [Bacteroidetes bacterium]|nr:geranylgeranyl reductase family protein [Bacteroidota bacterium]